MKSTGHERTMGWGVGSAGEEGEVGGTPGRGQVTRNLQVHVTPLTWGGGASTAVSFTEKPLTSSGVLRYLHPPQEENLSHCPPFSIRLPFLQELAVLSGQEA